MFIISAQRIVYTEKLTLSNGRTSVLTVDIDNVRSRTRITTKPAEIGDFSVVLYGEGETFDQCVVLMANDDKLPEKFKKLRIAAVQQYRSIERPCPTVVTTVYQKQW